MSPELSPDEIYSLTHYKRAAEQLRELQAMGIPARRRKIDNTICVLRMHTIAPSGAPITKGPTLKSSRK